MTNKENRRCAHCHLPLPAGTHPSRRYCSTHCSNRARRQREDSKAIAHREATEADHVLREFYCRNCGRAVDVVDEHDKRTVFCQRACEKKWWRDATRHKDRGRGGNLGMSGGMSIHSLIRREAEDLR